MEMMITVGAVVLLIAVLFIVKEAISKSERRDSKLRSQDIREKFSQLNKMATHIRV